MNTHTYGKLAQTLNTHTKWNAAEKHYMLSSTLQFVYVYTVESTLNLDMA